MKKHASQFTNSSAGNSFRDSIGAKSENTKDNTEPDKKQKGNPLAKQLVRNFDKDEAKKVGEKVSRKVTGKQRTTKKYLEKSSIYTEAVSTEQTTSKKLNKLQKKSAKVGRKLEKAEAKLPHRTEYHFERVYDEKKGRGRYVLSRQKKIGQKNNRAKAAVERAARKIQDEARGFVHGKIGEYEKENVGVEAANKSWQAGERLSDRAYDFVVESKRIRQQRQFDKVAKLNKKKIKIDSKYLYRKFLEENPELKKKALQKHFQKRRIKKEYAKAYRKGELSRDTTAIKNASKLVVKIAKKLQEIASKNLAVTATVLVFGLLLVMILSIFSSCGTMFTDTMTTVISGSYLSEPTEIDAAELEFTRLEMELQNEIDNIEINNPNYDEYRYNLGSIGHNPFTLISYLSVKFVRFTEFEVSGEIERLFNEMYTLTLTPVTEIRYRYESHSITLESGETITYTVSVPYAVSILETTLTVVPLESVVAGKMTEKQTGIYTLYGNTKGLLQQFTTPVDLYWYNYVSSYYGYRKNPNTGEQQLHRGIDIAVPTGTIVYATHDGTVTTATYDDGYGNYIVIEDEKGFVTKYAHLDSIDVTVGQVVTKGTPIGKTGNTGSSTGSHLHLEVLHNGTYYNPIFYFCVGKNTLYGEGTNNGSVVIPGDVVPPSSYDDETVQTLINEAEKYLGMPYTFGGTPPRSFDCSAFVCWVFTNSGVHNLPRTTAQGIYDQCTPVAVSEAKAGDIIFFTGTYNAGRPVTHVGIYCGDGIMIHCGDPIQYTSINSSYWQSHFYAFGRLSE